MSSVNPYESPVHTDETPADAEPEYSWFLVVPIIWFFGFGLWGASFSFSTQPPPPPGTFLEEKIHATMISIAALAFLCLLYGRVRAIELLIAAGVIVWCAATTWARLP